MSTNTKIDVTILTNAMLRAAAGAVGECWPSMEPLGTVALLHFAQTLEDLNQLHAAGQIDDLQAFVIAGTYRVATKDAISRVRGIGEWTGRAAAREAVAAAVMAARPIVNPAAGFRLI